MNRRQLQFKSPNQVSERSGTLTVEFALVSQIIFLLFFGCLELTSLNLMRHTAGNAAYEAARTAIVPGATEAQAKQKALDLLQAVGATKNITIEFTVTPDKVSVYINIPVKDNSWGLARFSGSSTIRKGCVLSREL